MSDVYASVLLGIAGFFIPSIFKGAIARGHHMTIRARECRDVFLFDSLLDPLAMVRWFRNPTTHQPSLEDQKKSSSRGTPVEDRKGLRGWRALLIPVALSLCAQVALVLLQLATTRELVGEVDIQGPGFRFDPVGVMKRDGIVENPSNATPRFSRCNATATGSESLTTLTSCYDSFFLLASIPGLAGDRYLLQIVRTVAKSLDTNNTMVLLALEIRSEIFIRQFQIVPRITSRSGEAYVSVKEDDISANNEAILQMADSILFSHDARCSRDPRTSLDRLNAYQSYWYTTVNCLGGFYALGNNPETSARFNTFAGVLASGFFIDSEPSKYYADGQDGTFAAEDLQEAPIEWVTTTRRVLSDGAILAILASVVALKLIVDVAFGEDVLFKAAFLVHQLCHSSPSRYSEDPGILDVAGKLEYKIQTGYNLASLSCYDDDDADDNDNKEDVDGIVDGDATKDLENDKTEKDTRASDRYPNSDGDSDEEMSV